jgi:hypothetical protein
MERLVSTPSVSRGCALLVIAFVIGWIAFGLVYINYPGAF